jgi:hypothetical protein
MLYGQTAKDPNAVLEQARVQLQAMAHNLEKYVCIENVERSYFQRVAPRSAPVRVESEPACGPAAAVSMPARDTRQLDFSDRVRLEVTVSDGRELHSWPGATRFDTRDVDELIRNGPVSTGAFGGYLSGVFDRPGVEFTYSSEQPVNGKTLFEYRYRVPLAASRFEIKANGEWRAVAYEGEFLLDPQTLELERMTVRSNGLPSGATFCSASTTLDYEHARIGDSEVLLPRQSQLEIVLQSGKETRNLTTFSNCREYHAESEIVFEGAPDSTAVAAPTTGRGRVSLPIGLPVTLALTAPIDTAKASAGDPVSAKVVKSVRRPGTSEELIPPGAVVSGRIRRVEHHLLPAPYFRVVLAFNRVEVKGALSPFFAHSDADPDLASKLGVNLAMRDTGVWYWGVGTFLVPSAKDHIVLPAGFESKWFTLATGGR